MGRHIGVSKFFFKGNIGSCICEQLKVLSFNLSKILKPKTFNCSQTQLPIFPQKKK